MNDQIKQTLLAKQDPFEDIIGQDQVKQHLKSALLMGRHIVVVGSPGIGKTTLAKNVAKIIPEISVVKGCAYHCDPNKPVCPVCKSLSKKQTQKITGEQCFVRIQGSPDLTVEDLLGDIDPIKAMKFGPLSIEAFTPGKIFKANRGVLFFDELNRCPEKLQNALLQVLQEGKATIGSYDVDFDVDFIFIATMNPQDSSTEKLSDVLLDRFDLIYMAYPETAELEMQIVETKGKQLVKVPDNLLNLMVYFVRLLRESKQVEKKPSVRASIGLYERSQSNAMLNNRKEIILDDIKDVLVSVLAHRLTLKPSAKYLVSPGELIDKEFDKLMESNIGREIKKKRL